MGEIIEALVKAGLWPNQVKAILPLIKAYAVTERTDLLAASEAQSALIRDLLNLVDPERRALMRMRLMAVSEQAFNAHQKACGDD